MRIAFLITSIHKAIIEKKQLKITYQSFKTDVPHTFVFSPFLLKEFRNRWFVFGERPRGKFRMENLALDRIVTLDVLDNSLYHMPKDFDPRAYFKDIIGVTRDNAPVETVRFWANGSTAPYIRTKPIHPSQMVVEVDPEDGRTLFQINVIINNELIRDLFGYAEGVQVVCPKSLVSTMKKKLMQAIELYK